MTAVNDVCLEQTQQAEQAEQAPVSNPMPAGKKPGPRMFRLLIPGAMIHRTLGQTLLKSARPRRVRRLRESLGEALAAIASSVGTDVAAKVAHPQLDEGA